MPRLSPSYLRRAHSLSPLLPLLLRSCRDLPTARNELRWLREHVLAGPCSKSLYELCVERSKGKPLQYILGNQPFGDINVLCEPGVLIPRPETEAFTTHIADLLAREETENPPPSNLRVLDLCTGTGCIPLLLHSLLSSHLPNLSITGIDISHTAICLAAKNLSWNVNHNNLAAIANDQIKFVRADLLTPKVALGASRISQPYDILISNPPYVSPKAYRRETSRSVRDWEPKLALVPFQGDVRDGELSSNNGDSFYPVLFSKAIEVNAKILLLEVADLAQAARVAKLATGTKRWDGIEIWRDWVCVGRSPCERLNIEGKLISVLGEGNGRAVICWRAEGGGWIGRT